MVLGHVFFRSIHFLIKLIYNTTDCYTFINYWTENVEFKILKLAFRLPSMERLLQSYTCSLKKDLQLHFLNGDLFVE